MSEEISRRSILVGAAIVPIASIGAAAAPATVSAPTTALTAAQLKTLDAFVDRIIPKDGNGPGASECGAANYIDRSLADALSAEKGTFVEGLTALDAFAMKSQGAAFADLAPEKRDTILMAMDGGTAEGWAGARTFFNRARRLTLEGTFGDPYYGGNKGFAGWDLIGYPGPRLAVAPEEQALKVTIKPSRISAWGGMSNGH
jgi:gluconate 2-dehydrogenase gamma chain